MSDRELMEFSAFRFADQISEHVEQENYGCYAQPYKDQDCHTPFADLPFLGSPLVNVCPVGLTSHKRSLSTL